MLLVLLSSVKHREVSKTGQAPAYHEAEAEYGSVPFRPLKFDVWKPKLGTKSHGRLICGERIRVSLAHAFAVSHSFNGISVDAPM